jgi:transcriptional regulator with XRE-family HTH domain
MRTFRVKELAQERGMTMEELAYRSSQKYSTVRNIWQNKVENPNYNTMAAIARALSVRIEDMVIEDGRSEVQSLDKSKTPSPAAALTASGAGGF